MGSFLLYKEQFKLCISEPVLFIGSVVARGTKKIPRGYPGGVGGVLRISRDRSLELLFQRLLSIVYTTTLIQSQFDYSDIVWGNCGKTLFDRLQKLQNRAARVLTFLDMMLMPTAYLNNNNNLYSAQVQLPFHSALQ